MKFSRNRDQDLLVKSLNKAVKAAGIVTQPDFTELLQVIAMNLIFADRRNGLVARVRKVGELPTEVIKANLKSVREAAEAGAPILAPLTTEILAVNAGLQSYVATLWPLADNRLVTPDEMVEVLHGIHDTPPPTGLPAWIDIRHGNTREKAASLRDLDNPPPLGVIDECVSLVEESMNDLERLSVGAPQVLLHGDAHPANIVIFKGSPVGVDFDEFSIGPPEADLSLTFVHAERYPGMDPVAGERLTAAFNRPYNAGLLQAMIRARTASKLVSLGRAWSEPGAQESILQRIKVIREGGKFAKLHGPESLCMFAEKILK